jgi:caffeoyl-CoA O-methyltransferase
MSESIVQYSESYSTGLTQWEEDIVKITQEELNYTNMLSSPAEISLMKQFISLTGAKRALEIGMFTGLMTTAIADAMGENSEIITTELNPKYMAAAEIGLDQLPFRDRIQLKKGSAIRTIMEIMEEKPFDIIFIDADKEMYPVYYDLLLPRLKSTGILILDNMLWKGKVIDLSDRKSKVLHELNKQITLDKRVQNTLLHGYDGWQMVSWL